ncbi:Ba166 [Baboon cytomegalovirus]|nr:Ba166 [Baboon cytomegalovirus]
MSDTGSWSDPTSIGLLVFGALCLLITIAGIIFLCHYPREAWAAMIDVFTCQCIVSCYRYGCDIRKFKTLNMLEDGTYETVGQWVARHYSKWMDRWRYGPGGKPDPVQYYSPPCEGGEEMINIRSSQPKQTVVTIEGGSAVTKLLTEQPTQPTTEQPTTRQPLILQTAAHIHLYIQEDVESTLENQAATENTP